MTLSPEQEARFGQRFPNSIAEVIDNFGSTTKDDIKSFLASEISLALAAREKEIEEAITSKIDQARFINGPTDLRELKEDILSFLRSPKEDNG